MLGKTTRAAGLLSYRRGRSNSRSVSLILFVAFLSAACATQPPQPGPFYNAPPPPVPAQPGQPVRIERLDVGVERADGYRILYSSRGIHDRPVMVSGMVLVPQSVPGAGGLPIVAWAHGTTGIARRCAPSLEPRAAMHALYGVQDLIDAGYIVVATDYKGLGTRGPHPYLIGVSEARSVLDAVRAARKQGAWRAGSRYVLWGYSQGGHAALFASQLTKSYAPELELLGTAVVAPPTDLAEIVRHDMDELAGKVLAAMVLKSWSELFPEAELSRIVRPRDVPFVDDIAKNCIETEGEALADLPAVELMGRHYLTRDPLTTEPWASIIRENSASPSHITVPLFVGQGTHDRIIPPSVTTNWVNEMCAHDPKVVYREYPGKDHVSVGRAAVNDVMAWIAERFAGQPAPTDCGRIRG